MKTIELHLSDEEIECLQRAFEARLQSLRTSYNSNANGQVLLEVVTITKFSEQLKTKDPHQRR